MKKLRHLLWRVFGPPNLPPRGFPVMPIPACRTTMRYRLFAELYNSGNSVSEIAAAFNLTNERIRQCIWKAYREYNF